MDNHLAFRYNTGLVNAGFTQMEVPVQCAGGGSEASAPVICYLPPNKQKKVSLVGGGPCAVPISDATVN